MTGAEFIDKFFSDTVHDPELRSIIPERAGAKRLFSRSLKALDQFITQQVARHENVYFGCCTRKGRVGDKAHCVEAPALWCDLDFHRLPEPEAEKRLTDFPLPPSIRIKSGGGLHVYWMLREPAGAHDARLEPILRGIAQTLGADPVCAELARVLRVPDTKNFKPEYGEPREVVIDWADWGRRYNLSDFEMFAAASSNENHANGEFLGIPIPSGVQLHEALATKLNFNVRHVGEETWYDYHGLRGFHGQPQHCLIQGSIHATQKSNPRQSSFVERDGKFAHHCFDSDCQTSVPIKGLDFEVAEPRDYGGKTRIALRALGLGPVLLQDVCSVASSAGFKLETLLELLNRPQVDTDWLWEGRLAAGTVSAVVSKPKVGKSTFARNLALAVSRGEPFLGLATKEGPVIYLALEERAEDVTADFRALGATGEENILIHADSAPAAGILAVADLVRKQKPVLVVIDPLFRIARIKDEKAYAETYAALGPLIDVARASGTHVLLTHHSGKSAKADPIDSPLGSTALGGAVSTLIVLRRTEAYRIIQAVQRLGQDLPETILQFASETRRLSFGGSKLDTDRKECERAIIEFLKDAGAPQTQAQIRTNVEGQTKAVRAALTALVRGEQVLKTGEGTKGKPFLYEFPNSGSQYSVGTSKPESQNVAQTRINTSEILVPDKPQRSILVPDTEPALFTLPQVTETASPEPPDPLPTAETEEEL